MRVDTDLEEIKEEETSEAGLGEEGRVRIHRDSKDSVQDLVIQPRDSCTFELPLSTPDGSPEGSQELCWGRQLCPLFLEKNLRVVDSNLLLFVLVRSSSK